ncbi:MAG TPA: TRAP transporter substrate-binding protein DctP [Rectinemataceae bacterium]|nr:TRAP transporter substrate-binding protein DctP [Rectinemataceae bacterium]
MIRSPRLALAALLAAIFAATLAAPLSAQTITLRMAAYVPTNSPWELGLRRIAADFDRISGGSVRIVFPQSVRVSDESDIIQKMRFGIDGALLTTYGIAQLYPDSLALSMPTLIRNDREFDAVLRAIVPLIKEKIGDRYVVLAVAKGGWVRFFSKRPIVYPEDLVGMRMSVNPDDTKVTRLLESAGVRTVKGDLSALLLQLNSNAVDAFYLSPVFTASLWSQFKGKVSYMSSFRVSPFIGAIVFNRSSWDRIPAELRGRLQADVQQVAEKMAADSETIENQAIAALLSDGMTMPEAPADSDSRWNDFMRQRASGIIASMFSPDILAAIDSALEQVRSGR